MYGLIDTLRDKNLLGVFQISTVPVTDLQNIHSENSANAFLCDDAFTYGFTIDLSANYQELPRIGNFPKVLKNPEHGPESLFLEAYPYCWVIQHEVIAQLITSLEKQVEFMVEMAKEFDDDAPSYRIDWAKENIEYLKEASQYSEFIFRPNMDWDDGVFDLMEDSECEHGIKQCIFIE
ncbi:hypothetical protein [Aliidiomarina celeris]|uniref:hypothetical protein n=1 Tax=Aliidiomarina celeris TaxID=2249428 RepID=UPI000DE9B170|nr:hypothetical protein [Aliidiomarina celeris]